MNKENAPLWLFAVLLVALPAVACNGAAVAPASASPTTAAQVAVNDPFVIDLVTEREGSVIVAGRLDGNRVKLRRDETGQVAIASQDEGFRPMQPGEAAVFARLLELELDKIDASAAELVVSVVKSMRPAETPRGAKPRSRGLTFDTKGS